MSQRRRTRERRRRSRGPEWKARGDAEALLPWGHGGVPFALDWSAPSRGMLRTLAMALRRGWLAPEDLGAFLNGWHSALDSGDTRHVIASAGVLVAADKAWLKALSERSSTQ